MIPANPAARQPLGSQLEVARAGQLIIVRRDNIYRMTTSPHRILGTLRAYQESAALNSAIELDVFTAIEEGAATAVAIAAKCAASERGIRMLCDTLVTTGILTKQDGHYSNAPDAAMFLDSRSPAFLGRVREFLCAPELLFGFARTLTDSVRNGGTTMPDEGSVSPENPIWVTFAQVMAPMMMPAAGAIATHMPASGPLKVLDIAAGHGLFGITVARRNPEAEIVALDWAAVLEVAKENAAAAGIAGRYSTIAGSAFYAPMGEGYDVILLTNFLHHFDAATNEALLRRVHAALKPGGRAVTLEFCPDDDRVKPVFAARFVLTMLSTTARGDAFTFAELDAMFRNAGFAGSVCHRIETEQSVIVSTK